MSNYVASGWRRDLVHFIGCCWTSQVGSLQEEGWQTAIMKFMAVMTQRKKEWVDLKEPTPLRYMPYAARLFYEVTGKDLRGLDRFTGWIGQGGYYHWRLVQQGLIHHVPRLQDEPIPKVPKSHPSGWPLPAGPPSAGTQALEAATGPLGQPTPQGGGSRPASNQGSTAPTTSQSGGPPPPVGVGSHRLPAKVLPQPPRKVPLTSPPEVQDQGTAPAGTRLPFKRLGVRSLNPKGLPFQSPRPKSGESRLAKYMAVWSESSHLTPTSSQGAYGPTTLELIYRLLICGPARPSV